MTRYTERPIRIRDADGKLIGAGYQWLEERPMLHSVEFILCLVWCTLTLTYFDDVWRFVVGSPPAGAGILTMLALAFVLPIAIWWLFHTGKLPAAIDNLGWRRRALIIYSSGQLSAPYGLSNRKYFPGWRPIHQQLNAPIVSIQASGEIKIFPVNIYCTDGRRILVSIACDHDESRQLAVELTRAHQELKAASLRPPDTSNTIIN